MGTSAMVFLAKAPRKDHPHAYGDKISAVANAVLKSGSSPRVWGQAQYYFAVAHGHRIIPTRMGTSLACKSAVLMALGSSPRVWGQAYNFCKTRYANRIIPTRMGTSLVVLRQQVLT